MYKIYNTKYTKYNKNLINNQISYTYIFTLFLHFNIL